MFWKANSYVDLFEQKAEKYFQSITYNKVWYFIYYIAYNKVYL